MDNSTRESVEKELQILKTKIVLNEAQLLAMQMLQVPTEQTAKLNQQMSSVKTQVAFDKAYASILDDILNKKEDK